ncbi:LysE family translocator [Aliivibrio fischeri]|uniref:LysE family translocator n=1 Tax=Aliivibrio fischeri TaxID=668 RepID=UPI00080DDD4A|nr:LysE family translocator [Aliivibrio fischeri]OCH21021.1 threonine transporter RhtB [Aliivibrio fischeri]USR94426.1 LysE family translocator [Aliivibrio fischeri ATCC 7744 = JCM 18803 = DSM 507]
MIMDFWAFFIAILLLTMTPGLDTALVIRNTTRGGWKDGITCSLGICCGLFVHATMSAVGLSVVLVSSAELFTVVKTIGAIYLIWLGVQSIRSTFSHSQSIGMSSNKSLEAPSLKVSFKEGFLSNILNPKTAVFYLALLPQFINPEYSAFAQSLLMASIHFVIAMIWQGGVALLVEKAKQLMSSSVVKNRIERVTGAVLVMLGVNLLVSK